MRLESSFSPRKQRRAPSPASRVAKILRGASAPAAIIALLLAPQSGVASKISDAVTAGNDASISNGFNVSLDLGEVFVLEASWQLLDTDSGTFNSFTGGGDLKLTKAFDLDLLADFAPRTGGIATTGFSLTPTFELDEGDDFYTSFSLPMFIEHYDVETTQLITACHKSGRMSCAKPSMQQANLDLRLNQLAAGIAVEQGVHDATFVGEIMVDRYSDTSALSLFGRELKGGGRMSFNQVGGLLPSFPVLFQTKTSAAYKLRFGRDNWFTLKPLVSESHLVYEANHGHGDTIVAKVVAGFWKTFEVTAGYQVLFDRSFDTSASPPVATPNTIHYGLIGFAFLFGKDPTPPDPVASSEAGAPRDDPDSANPDDEASAPVATAAP